MGIYRAARAAVEGSTGKVNKPTPVAKNNFTYPTVCSLVDREAAMAIECLAKYVRPQGDYILTRSMLDEIDRAIGEIEAILNHKWNGQSWRAR